MPRFPFPTTFEGWYQVAYADELVRGGVLPLRCFGRDLVAFRDEDGAAHVLDAHCPHLGAHLGHGGRVHGSTITCPFHAWSFGADGACVAIPTGDRIPPKARLAAWTVHEVNGMLLVHHPAPLAPREAPPSWHVPEVAEHESPRFHPVVRHRWRVRSHVHELAENIVDAPHFVSVHKALSQPTMSVECDAHVLRTTSTMKQRTPRGDVDARIDGIAYGVSYWVLRFTGIVDTVFVSALTPVDDEHVDVRFSFMVTRDGGADPHSGVGAALIADVVEQVNQDIPIWENKVYRESPVLCAADKPITTFRRWASQFVTPRTDGGRPVSPA
jgi:phenylpropionate dioxygenase-like ring-hydroxylating dioxygenase large terminal subunit